MPRPHTLRHRYRLAAVAAVILAALGCVGASSAAATPPPPTPTPPATIHPAAEPPTLIVLITVDQLRGDFLLRFQDELKLGLGRLMQGAHFTNAFQDHAITETAPGHASLLSGRFPAHTGIISNSIGVVDRNFALLGGLASEPGASPHRFVGTTLYDWLAAKDRRSRALSVSTKDRGAILTVGHAKQDVYWYSVGGSFTTSTYYKDSLPDWVHAFNARHIPFSYAGAAWRLTRPESFYKEPDTVRYERNGSDNVFPHAFPASESATANMIRATPSMDSLTALFALEGVRRTGVGRGPQTDLLAVSFSATDYVGHSYGPDSREAHENLLRLDETIGWFLDSLFAMRSPGTVLVALSADHGVQSNPELARELGLATGDEGMRVSLNSVVERVRAGMRGLGADPDGLIYDTELVGFDRRLLNRSRLNADSLRSTFAAAARRVPGVARVDRLSDLKRADPVKDPIARRWLHQVPDNAGVDMVITLTPYSVWGGLVATHGSPYDLDAHVPILFYGAGIKPGRYDGFVRTVDLAPTLALLAGVQPTERLDGVALTDVIVR